MLRSTFLLLVLFTVTIHARKFSRLLEQSESDSVNKEQEESSFQVECGSVMYSASHVFPARAPRRYQVELTDAPSTRWPWTDILASYNETVFEALEMIAVEIPTKVLQDFAEDEAAKLLPKLGEYGEEMSSLAQAINVSVGKIVLLNVIYDVVAGFCTSIVACTPEGVLFHARNLDFDLASVLTNLTIQVEFTRNHQVVAVGTTYAGYVGLLTGMHIGNNSSNTAYSVSLNERDSGLPIFNLLEYWFIEDTWDPALLIRKTLETCENFTAAVQVLSETSLVAPCYIIVGGIGYKEGVVLTRDRSKTDDAWYLNATATEGRWFLVQTNFDHWKSVKIRAQVAEDRMSAIGREDLSLDTLYSVLSTVPVINHSTTYTTLMCPQTGNFTTLARTSVPIFSSTECSIRNNGLPTNTTLSS